MKNSIKKAREDSIIMKTITPKELDIKMKENNLICILDVRTEEKYNEEHINKEI